MTLNVVIAVTLHYFTEFGKPALQKTICGGIYARVYCIFSACTMSAKKKFTFAISSPDEFLVEINNSVSYRHIVNCLEILVSELVRFNILLDTSQLERMLNSACSLAAIVY